MNGGAEAVFGYAADEVLGRRLDVLIPERFRSVHWRAFDEAIETGQQKCGRESMTTRSVHKNGSDLYVELSLALVNDGAGGVLGAVAMARDVMSRYMTRTRRRVGASRSWRSRSRPCPLGIDRSCFGCKLVLED